MEKRVLITGGSSGIGKALVDYFLQNQYHVITISRRRIETDELCNNLQHIQCDIADYQTILTQLNNQKIDIIINNAGITDNQIFQRMKDEEIMKVMNTNLIHTMLLTKKLLSLMNRGRQSRIINISSVIATQGNVGQVSYAASKAGLLGMTRSLARELAKRETTVNSISPGFIDTSMTATLSTEIKERIISQIPLQRMGSVSDIIKTVQFIIDCNYITGSNIHINGGLYMN